jgi:hypothetical protein
MYPVSSLHLLVNINLVLVLACYPSLMAISQSLVVIVLAILFVVS